ncbi:hypothetical protein QYF36_012986 [Acer negundo]|nr:hypothetical protein QYF36_012986 [Acer negundo]
MNGDPASFGVLRFSYQSSIGNIGLMVHLHMQHMHCGHMGTSFLITALIPPAREELLPPDQKRKPTTVHGGEICR